MLILRLPAHGCRRNGMQTSNTGGAGSLGHVMHAPWAFSKVMLTAHTRQHKQLLGGCKINCE